MPNTLWSELKENKEIDMRYENEFWGIRIEIW